MQTMEKTYDIVVIGSGPAGCSFLNSLDKKYRVLLIDKQKMPVSKICGGLLTEESYNFFKEKKLDIPTDVYSHPKKLKKVYLDLNNGKEIENGFVYNVERDKFNKWMFSLVRKYVDILERTSLQKMEISDKKIKLTLHDLKKDKKIDVFCKYVIGADGVYSKVREELSILPATRYLAIQSYVKLNNNFNSLMMFFSKDLTDHFIWVVPKDKFIIVGLSLPYETNNKIEEQKIETAKKLVEAKINKKIKFYKREGYLVTIPKTSKELCLGKNNVLLIGEAAGWISARSGDGISFALRSANNCAKAFNEVKGNFLDSYVTNSQELKKEFDEKLETFIAKSHKK